MNDKLLDERKIRLVLEATYQTDGLLQALLDQFETTEAGPLLRTVFLRLMAVNHAVMGALGGDVEGPEDMGPLECVVFGRPQAVRETEANHADD